MYLTFYKLIEKPFEITPDASFLYMSPGHREALAALLYGIFERRGFVALIGEVGTGKSTLINATRVRLSDDIKFVNIVNSNLPFNELLSMALSELDLVRIGDQMSMSEAVSRLNDFAIQQSEKGGNVVLVVDEAQHLDHKTLENLKLLSNLETQKKKLIQIILSGQPELDQSLARHDLRQLAQRIAIKRYIYPFNKSETYAYIHHRLKVAMYKGPPLFHRKALKLIWKYSGGVPRKINILCDNALLIGFALKKTKIKAPMIREAVSDLGWNKSIKKYLGKRSIASVPLTSRTIRMTNLERAMVVLLIMVFILLMGFWTKSENMRLENHLSRFSFVEDTQRYLKIGTRKDHGEANHVIEGQMIVLPDISQLYMRCLQHGNRPYAVV
jgi:general secretion pathway protein A